MGTVVVFGSLNMDLSIAADRMPQQGETLSGHGFCTNPGGKGANQAVAAAKAGVPTKMVGAVGGDPFGEGLRFALERCGVDCSGVRTADGCTSGVAVIVRTAGDNRIVLDPGANGAIWPEGAAEAVAERGGAGDIFLAQMECDIETTASALHAAHEAGMRTLLNVAPLMPVPDALWPDIDIVCVNETECAALTGILPEDDATAAAALEALRALGPSCAIVTLGAAGSCASVGDELIFQPADRIVPVDTTASGDTYIGYLAASLVSGLGFAEAMARSTHAAGLTATRVGAQQAIPCADEVDRLS